MVVDLDIPWLKRLDDKPDEPDEDELERIEYETKLEELEFR